MTLKKTNSSQIVKDSYIKLKKINTKLKNFNINLTIKGNSSSFDSVDTITFFSILEKELEKHGLKNPNFLNDKFFFKYENIKITDVVNIVRKKNEKR